MALEHINGYGLVDDGMHVLKSRNMCSCNNSGINMETISEMIKNEVSNYMESNIKEENDVLYVNGKKVMTDDYVVSGEYNGDGTATLTTTDGKTATIENLPQAISDNDVANIIDNN